MTLETRYRIPSTVILQKVDCEPLLFNSATGLFFTLNDVGEVIWEVMSKNSSLQIVLEELLETFSAPKDQLERDLLTFASSLNEQELLLVS